MIEIRRLDRSLDYSKYNEIYMITLSMKFSNPNIKHMPELAPPPNLFGLYRDLVNKGQWNKKAFEELYVPKFIHYIKYCNKAREKLYELLNKARMPGNRICLLCYCTDEELCHRSIIAGILQGMCSDVVITSGNDYSHYYDMYLNIPVMI